MVVVGEKSCDMLRGLSFFTFQLLIFFKELPLDDVSYQISLLLATVLIVLLRVLSNYLSDRDSVVVIGLWGELTNTTAHSRALCSFLEMCSFKNECADFIWCFNGSPSVPLLSETLKVDLIL
jgi:hypothetical protein